MEALKMLETEAGGKTTLEDLVSVFEKMCMIPIDGIEKEDEMILFETGTFSFSDESLFYFGLVRQFPDEEDEYYQIHLDIQYKPSEANKAFHETTWNTDIQEDIFDYIKSSEVYATLASEDIYTIDIYMEQS